ncbi:hypothetical protein G3G77_004701 [Salmonella enterica]|nr:hypothetical protein [Salmonella enterica]EEH5466481.1 hypothetical protein [Salmonella enterica]EEH7555966.1 hypothetical protein [Salmonella enterica]EEO5640116.1 hypothetical protein [Salmonella enterica]EEQ0204225.1 hypothetical protein [Salmonella enterica]
MVQLASRPCVFVDQIARENGVNENVILKWLRLWQNEGRVSRRLPTTISTSTNLRLCRRIFIKQTLIQLQTRG